MKFSSLLFYVILIQVVLCCRRRFDGMKAAAGLACPAAWPFAEVLLPPEQLPRRQQKPQAGAAGVEGDFFLIVLFVIFFHDAALMPCPCTLPFPSVRSCRSVQ